MWKLYYEDTFGFGEDRDPPTVECSGEDIEEGFLKLWTCVLNESVVISSGEPAVGFATFILVIESAPEGLKSIPIDVHKHIAKLGALKKDVAQNAIKETAAAHCKAVLNNEEDGFWNNFDCPKDAFKVPASPITENMYQKRFALYLSAMIFANILFLFCLLSAVQLFSAGKTTESIWAGLFAVVALTINFSYLSIQELRLRYRNPEKFYIEINETSFIHSNGEFIKKIPVHSIDTVREEEILSRGGVHSVFIVNHTEDNKRKEYSFYKTTSRKNVIYDITAEKMNAYIQSL